MPCYGMCRGNYQAGDYYRGDYYRGDPGVFDFLKKVGKGVASIGGKILGATPVGAVVKTVAPIVGRALLPPPQQPEPPVMLPPPGFQSPYLGPQVFQARAGLFCGPDGTRRGRWNKSTYITRGGGTSRWPPTLLVHQKGTECVAPRRMNVANPRALRRALRRAAGFAKLASRYVRVQKRFKKGKRRRR